MKKKLLLIMFLVLGAITMVSAQNSVLKLLPLGNSITNGWPDAYRYTLWAEMVQNGYDVDFIGTRNGHGRPSGTPDVNGKEFDENHQGYPGITTGETKEQIDSLLG